MDAKRVCGRCNGTGRPWSSSSAARATPTPPSSNRSPPPSTRANIRSSSYHPTQKATFKSPTICRGAGRPLLSIAVGLLILIGIRATMRLFMPRAGKALGEKLHGKSWLTSGHGSTLDWRRFADACHFTPL